MNSRFLPSIPLDLGLSQSEHGQDCQETFCLDIEGVQTVLHRVQFKRKGYHLKTCWSTFCFHVWSDYFPDYTQQRSTCLFTSNKTSICCPCSDHLLYKWICAQKNMGVCTMTSMNVNIATSLLRVCKLLISKCLLVPQSQIIKYFCSTFLAQWLLWKCATSLHPSCVRIMSLCLWGSDSNGLVITVCLWVYRCIPPPCLHGLWAMADKDHTFIFITPHPPPLKDELTHIVNSHCDHITRPNTFDLRQYGSRAWI